MRSTAEVIKELDEEAANFTGVGLAVGFESPTTFIFANDPARLEELNEAAKAGGEPIGFIGFDLHNGMLTLQSRPLAEHADEQWVNGYLHALTGNFSKILKENYNVKDILEKFGTD
ncbi:MAG: hypothetical protein WB660_00600 [Candidatus Sulfotelmatobacter sp.]